MTLSITITKLLIKRVKLDPLPFIFTELKVLKNYCSSFYNFFIRYSVIPKSVSW